MTPFTFEMVSFAVHPHDCFGCLVQLEKTTVRI